MSLQDGPAACNNRGKPIPHDPEYLRVSTGSYGNLVFTANWKEVYPTAKNYYCQPFDSDSKCDGSALTIPAIHLPKIFYGQVMY